MKKLVKTALSVASVAILSTTVQAAEITVDIENLTRSIYFTPLAVAAHAEGSQLFTSGAAASSEVQAMAEGGDIASLETLLEGWSATQDNNPAAGLLFPGASTTSTLNTDGTSNTQLSVVAMMLPTNDAFIALNAITIPTEAGVYTFLVNAYDAGTEANDEIRGSGASGEAGMPVPPPMEAEVGTNGTGVAATIEGYVHIHRGSLGDAEITAGVSDIDSTRHRWLNPVAKITVTVN